MHTMWLVIPALATALAGCSTFPRQGDVTRKSTYDIVQQIRCEARRAVIDIERDKHIYYYRTATVAYEFDFNITETNNATAEATWGLPYTLGGNLSVSADAGVNRNRSTMRNIKLKDTFDELLAIRYCADDKPAENFLYPIAGDIGVYEVVQTFIKLQQVDNPQSGSVFTFGDTLMFTTNLTGGVHPRLVITPVTDRFRLAGAEADLSASRNDVHKVTLTFAGDPPKANKTLVGASLRAPAGGIGGGVQTNSSLISTTMIQAGANPTDRALIELDRQRILALQARSLLLVGP